MTKDLNKGIQGILYNSLNLPQEMVISHVTARAKNYYTYTATGVKLKVRHINDPTLKEQPILGSTGTDGNMTGPTTDYVGNKIYEDGTLKTILTDNGYIEGNTYYFYIKDHLGNNRIVANASASVIQSNQYYPFGMAFAEGTTTEQGKQPYKYNGKELDQSHGLNQYDYQARFLDNAYGRFTTMDPLSEKKPWLSPYVYCSNNPMNRIDPDGRDDYRLDRDGNMHFVKETEASNHTIYATNAKGNINTKSSINVDKYVISGKETVTGVQGRRSDGSIETSTIDIYTSAGDKQSTALFEFASKNTDVEWSQTKTTQNGVDVNYIATSHSGNTDVGQSYVISRIFSQNDKNSIMGLIGTNIREANHSHPNGSTIVSGGDANSAKTLQSRFPNAKMHNYTPNDGKYTFFDEYSEPGLLPEIEIVAPRKKK